MTRRPVGDQALLQHGINLECTSLAWNVVGIVVVGLAAIGARSVAPAGFGLDSAVEIGASMVVLGGLAGTDEQRQHQALRLIGGGYIALYIAAHLQNPVLIAEGRVTFVDGVLAVTVLCGVAGRAMRRLGHLDARGGRAHRCAAAGTRRCGRWTLATFDLSTQQSSSSYDSVIHPTPQHAEGVPPNRG